MEYKKRVVWTKEKVEKIRQMNEEGISVTEIAKELGYAYTPVRDKMRSLMIIPKKRFERRTKMSVGMINKEISQAFKERFETGGIIKWNGKNRIIKEVSRHFIVLRGKNYNETVSDVDLMQEGMIQREDI